MKFKITLQYDGSRFKGWQVNKKQKTIQGSLMEGFSKVFETEKFDFQGAGRTDTGVHALGQVAHLELETAMKPALMHKRINHFLPNEIRVIALEETDERFHARHSAIARTYLYVINKQASPFLDQYSWLPKNQPEIQLLRKLATTYMGSHDFASFCYNPEKEKTTQINIRQIAIMDNDHSIVIRITASHFLWKMVRRLVGVMVATASGEIEMAQAKQFLHEYSAEPGKMIAPAWGLFLEKVHYPGDEVPGTVSRPYFF